MVCAAAPRSAISMSRNSASSELVSLPGRPFETPKVSDLPPRWPMPVKRLEREALGFGVEPDALQRPQGVAERDQMYALRTVRSERRCDEEDGPPHFTGISSFL